MLLDRGKFVYEGPPERLFETADPVVRTFVDASAVEPHKLDARRALRKSVEEVRKGWEAAHPRRIEQR
jgi:ABC-type transporter Mla maintaining outer membrane lipid asymmetry ATPase subunit MlaF